MIRIIKMKLITTHNLQDEDTILIMNKQDNGQVFST